MRFEGLFKGQNDNFSVWNWLCYLLPSKEKLTDLQHLCPARMPIMVANPDLWPKEIQTTGMHLGQNWRPERCWLTYIGNGAHLSLNCGGVYLYIYIYIILPHSQATNSITNAMEYDPELRNAESLGGDALYVFLSLFIAWLAGLLQGSCKRYLGWCLLLSACIRNWAGCQGLDNLTYKEASSLARWVDTGCNML